ncbi:MAG: hypothetical protein PHR06_06075 [Candidatus Cloacimonetes bacterium]|nr:hypothetical protein [Candidatus Cloacimonadota bacterium]
MNQTDKKSVKVNWQGKVVSIQPRTRVWRYLIDNRTHYHIGYNLFLADEEDAGKTFSVAISEKQLAKGLFRVGDILKGTAWTKIYKQREFADYYRVGSIEIISRESRKSEKLPPPWIITVPSLQIYEERGARQLSKSRWNTKCFQCIWANMANVEVQWDFDRNIKKYRFESFCYGPKSCKFYTMGKPRPVSYKNLGPVHDEGWLDDICTERRGEDE